MTRKQKRVRKARRVALCRTMYGGFSNRRAHLRFCLAMLYGSANWGSDE